MNKKVESTSGHNWRSCQDENCEECQTLIDYGIAGSCDFCGTRGLLDAEGFLMGKDNQLYCRHCAETLPPFEAA